MLIRGAWRLLLPEAARTGSTALWYAAGNGHLEVVRELAKAGSDVNYRDVQGPSGLSVVEVAFENGHDDVAALLILTYGAEDTVGVENLR
jgi:ankyrin repeat protein